jgi:hypothetical protein
VTIAAAPLAAGRSRKKTQYADGAASRAVTPLGNATAKRSAAPRSFIPLPLRTCSERCT